MGGTNTRTSIAGSDDQLNGCMARFRLDCIRYQRRRKTWTRTGLQRFAQIVIDTQSEASPARFLPVYFCLADSFG